MVSCLDLSNYVNLFYFSNTNILKEMHIYILHYIYYIYIYYLYIILYVYIIYIIYIYIFVS